GRRHTIFSRDWSSDVCSSDLTETNLIESGGHAESYSLFLTDGSEQSDISTVINHKSADTTSDQISKGIMSGSSKGIFTGKIHIRSEERREGKRIVHGGRCNIR